MISARAVELAGTQGTIEAANGARLTLSGTVSGAASLVKEGLGTLVLNGTNSYDGNTFVNAGRLEGNADSILGNLANNGETVFDQASNGTFGGKVEGSGLVIKDGDGELILTGGSSAQWQVDGGMLASSALRFTGDVDIGAAGTMTFDQIANAGYGGTLSGSGRLLKTDAGLLELSADSGDFAGTTTVAAGTLRVTNTLGGTVAVEDGASLGGSGIGEFTGAVTIADGGTLLGRQGETLTMGSLTLGDAANVNVALGAPGTLALFDVTGGLTLDGILNVQDLGGFGPGLYRLFDYGGVLTDNGMDVGSTPAGVLASDLSIQTAIDNEINLVSAAGATLAFWDGPNGPNNGVIDGGDGVWNTANHNWTDANGAVNAPWGNGQFAIFQGNAGTVTVETDAGISVTGMQFAVDGYTVTGSAIALQNQETVIRVGTGARSGETMTATIASVLYGTSALVKHDYGTLILSQANLYSGGTFVRGGVLQVADDRSLGADTGGLVIDNATLRTTADMASARAVELAGTHGTDRDRRRDQPDAVRPGLWRRQPGEGGRRKAGAERDQFLCRQHLRARRNAGRRCRQHSRRPGQ